MKIDRDVHPVNVNTVAAYLRVKERKWEKLRRKALGAGFVVGLASCVIVAGAALSPFLVLVPAALMVTAYAYANRKYYNANSLATELRVYKWEARQEGKPIDQSLLDHPLAALIEVRPGPHCELYPSRLFTAAVRGTFYHIEKRRHTPFMTSETLAIMRKLPATDQRLYFSRLGLLEMAR